MIQPIAPVDFAATEFVKLQATQPQATITMQSTSFTDMLSQGIQSTNTKLVEADKLVARYAIDQSVPLHEVTYALEQARLSFELMIQVRNRMLEASQQLMNMQI